MFEAIEAKSLTKSYGIGDCRNQVLRDIDLRIPAGEFAVILGASGSGKSTLLNILSGLERPDGGSVCYGEIELSRLSERELTEFRKNTVGLVFQQYYLLPHMTVEQNVKLGADLTGTRDDRCREILTAVGMGEKCRRYPGELSGGEQQRVAIARALAKRPQVLFLDEPTGALDEETGRQVLDYLAHLQKEYGFTAVMVTHNQNIAQMANTVIRMNSGKLSDITSNTSPKGAYEIGW